LLWGLKQKKGALSWFDVPATSHFYVCVVK